MSFTEKHIVASYSDLFEGLSSSSKAELIENLSKSLKTNKGTKDDAFYKSFGGFVSKKSTGEIINDIKQNRKFRTKDVHF